MILPIKNFKVVGHSMEPLFKEGDRAIINRLAYLFGSPKVGDIVALRNKNLAKKILLKKVDKVSRDGNFFVVGLNKGDSLDSQKFGAVSKKDIIGKVLTRY